MCGKLHRYPKIPKELQTLKKFHGSSIACQVSCVACHISHVTCHLSPVTCHVSPVMCQLSPVTCHRCQQPQQQPTDNAPTFHSRLVHQNPKPNNTRFLNLKFFSKPLKNSFCCCILAIPSLTRSLQATQFQSPIEGTTNKQTNIWTLRLIN